MDVATREGSRVTRDVVVMASIDRQSDGDQLVIADIATDGQWLSIPLSHAVVLPDHR